MSPPLWATQTPAAGFGQFGGTLVGDGVAFGKPPAAEAEWHGLGSQPENWGLSATGLPTSSPSNQWTTTVVSSDNIGSCFVIGPSNVYGVTEGGIAFGLDRASGDVLFTNDLGPTGPADSPFLNAQRGEMYVGFWEGTTFETVACSTDDGSVLWRHDPGTTSNGDTLYPLNVTGANGYVVTHCGTYNSGSEDTLFVLDPADGSEVWLDNDEGDVASKQPAIDTTEGRLVWGDAGWMERTLSDGTHGASASVAPVHGSCIDWPYVYTSDDDFGDYNVYAHDARDGSLVWSITDGGLSPDSAKKLIPAYDGTYLYAHGVNGNVSKYAVSDGTLQWNTSPGISGFLPAGLSDDASVLAGTSSSTLYGVDTSDGSTLWSVSVANDWYALGNGGAYVNGPNSDEVSFYA